MNENDYLDLIKYSDIENRLVNNGFIKIENCFSEKFTSPVYKLSLFNDYSVMFDVFDKNWNEGNEVSYGLYCIRYSQITDALRTNKIFDFQCYCNLSVSENYNGLISHHVAAAIEILDNEVYLVSGGVEYSVSELASQLKNITSNLYLYDAYYADNSKSEYNETKLYAFGGTNEGLWAYLFLSCEANKSAEEILEFCNTIQMEKKLKHGL